MPNAPESLAPIDPAQLVARYRVIREASRALHSRLLSHLSPFALARSAKKIGVTVAQGTIVFDSEEEMNILCDYALYDYRDGPAKGRQRNALEKMLVQDPPPEGSEELEILKAGVAARYTLLKVESPRPGVGADVIDLFAERNLLLVDVQLSETVSPGNMFATRVVSRSGISMTTGAALPLDQQAQEDVMRELGPVVKNLKQGLKVMTAQEQTHVATIIIRTCLRCAEAIRFA